MNYYSLSNRTIVRTFGEALREGLAPDRGLFVPAFIPVIPGINDSDLSLPELGATMLLPYVEKDLNESQLLAIMEEALNFPIPLVPVEDNLHLLELFHGPTAAFKDVGARIMSRLLSAVTNERLTVLVATSGDTGSAVAQGFFNVPGIDVVILYPQGRISEIQERQLTTVGGNVVALEVAGSFDDCQELVKMAFMDRGLQRIRPLTSANSINIGRWLPQSIYYAWARNLAQEKLHVVVPSGNFGNIAAGVLAKKMGSKLGALVSAVNSNAVMAEYFATDQFLPLPSVATISNAMDVGDPSNRPRLEWMFDGSFKGNELNFSVHSVDEASTRDELLRMHRKYGHLVCPHTAVGTRVYEHMVKEKWGGPSAVLATAHPAKFGEIVTQSTGVVPVLPESLLACTQKTPHRISISNQYSDLQFYLRNE